MHHKISSMPRKSETLDHASLVPSLLPAKKKKPSLANMDIFAKKGSPVSTLMRLTPSPEKPDSPYACTLPIARQSSDDGAVLRFLCPDSVIPLRDWPPSTAGIPETLVKSSTFG